MNSTFSMDIFVIENGRTVVLSILDDDSLESIRQQIYKHTPSHCKICVTCDEDTPNGSLSNLSYEEYIKLSDNPILVYPMNTKTKIWGKTVLYFRLNKIDLSKFKDIEDHLRMKTKVDIEFDIEFETEYEDGFVEYERYIIPETPLYYPEEVDESYIIAETPLYCPEEVNEKVLILETPLNSPKKVNEKVVISETPKEKEIKLIYQHEAFQKFYEQLEKEKNVKKNVIKAKNTLKSKKKKDNQPSLMRYCALKLIPLK